MRRRHWDAKIKALIVLEGLKGRSVAAIGPEYQISHSLYDPWHDQFLANTAHVFEDPQLSRTEARLAQEHIRLKPLIGALIYACNTSDERLA